MSRMKSTSSSRSTLRWRGLEESSLRSRGRSRSRRVRRDRGYVGADEYVKVKEYVGVEEAKAKYKADVEGRDRE